MTRSTTRSYARPVGRLAALALAAATALSAASCAAIPGSGPVHAGLSDLKQIERLVQFTAAGPTAGATQEQLVRGFLIAAQSSANDYQIAREFLAANYAKDWNPGFGVLVSDGSKPYRSDGDTSGVLSVSLVAKIDATGRELPVQTTGSSTDFRFEFTKEGDEWRISAAPAGIILDQGIFTQIWASHQLYFLGPGDRLVPETRWFLSSAALATEMVGALIAGPSERLAQVVHSGFPPGVRLTNNAVPVVDGEAQVDLVGDGLGNPKAQQEILAQLRASFGAVSGVNGVALFIDGAAVRQTPEPSSPTVSTAAQRAIAVIKGDEFGVLLPTDKVEAIPGLSQRVPGLTPISMSLSRSREVAAVRTIDGVSIVHDGTVSLIDTRTALLEPSVDDDLWTWTLSAASTSSVRVTSTTGAQYDLQAPWLEGMSVRSLRVSPGGSLLAALVSDGEKSSVLVGGIVRDNDGVPTGLSQTGEIEAYMSGAALDFDWVDQLRFVVLTKQGTAGKVWVGGPGLFLSEQGSVADAVHVVGGGGRTYIRVLNSTGELFAPQGGSGWQRVSKSIQVLAKRG